MKDRQAIVATFITNFGNKYEMAKMYTIKMKEYNYSGELFKRVINTCENMKKCCSLENDGLIFTSMGDFVVGLKERIF